jgi:hypothetical protein
VKVGDLVRKKYKPGMMDTKVGIILAINEGANRDSTFDTPVVRVQWPADYGCFWTTSASLEIVSKA